MTRKINLVIYSLEYEYVILYFQSLMHLNGQFVFKEILLIGNEPILILSIIEITKWVIQTDLNDKKIMWIKEIGKEFKTAVQDTTNTNTDNTADTITTKNNNVDDDEHRNLVTTTTQNDEL